MLTQQVLLLLHLDLTLLTGKSRGSPGHWGRNETSFMARRCSNSNVPSSPLPATPNIRTGAWGTSGRLHLCSHSFLHHCCLHSHPPHHSARTDGHSGLTDSETALLCTWRWLEKQRPNERLAPPQPATLCCTQSTQATLLDSGVTCWKTA